MLDTLSMVEVWRQKVRAPKFSETFYKRAQAASFRLFNMINIKNGEGPNIGANDGARLLPLTNTKYRDFRPTVQLAYNLFFNQRAIEEIGPWDDSLKWLKISSSTIPTVKANSFNAGKGGFSVLRKREAMVLLKYPMFKFRPSHADALHVDLWIKGFSLSVEGSEPFDRKEIVDGWQSLHYLEKTKVSVMEIEVSNACSITTNVEWLN